MLVSFKLHGGKVPYFIEHYLGGISLNNRYFGITIKEDSHDYIPDTLEVLTREGFIDIIKSILITKGMNEETHEPIYMTPEEKEIYIDNWLKERGY
jgi:hypothetical protein